MKRWICILLALSLTLAMFAGCARGENDEPSSASEAEVSEQSAPAAEPSSEAALSPPQDSEPEPSEPEDEEPGAEPPASDRASGSAAAAASAPEPVIVPEQPPLSSLPEGRGVSLYAEQPVYPVGAESMKVHLINETNGEGSVDMYYAVQHLNDGQWRDVPLEFAVQDTALVVMPWETYDFTIWLYPEQYNYAPGDYRICKTAYVADAAWELTASFLLE